MNNFMKQVKYVLSKMFTFLKLFLKSSNIHGLGHIFGENKHPAESLIWFSLVCLAIYSSSVLSGLTLNRYQESPTVISIERDRFSWNTSFPGATICPTNKLNEGMLNAYVENSVSKNKTALREFIVSLSEATYGTFHKVIHYDDIPSDSYFSLLLSLKYEFKPTISNSALSQLSKLDMVISEMGFCYMFNSQLAVYGSPNYWNSGKWTLEEPTDILYINPLDGEIYATIVNMSTGYTIYTHGPYEVADSASKGNMSPNGYLLQLYFRALSIISTDRTRKLAVTQRKCRFYDESNLKHSPVYSYVLCRMECRIAIARSLCGCTPHFYRQIERLITLKGECSCLPNCEEVTYAIDSIDGREWFLGSNLALGIKEYPTMRLKRDVIFGFTDLLVYIGGMTGLFLGCSVLSFIEILYFFSVRLWWFIRNHKKNVSSL